jgi:hypothetical protein
MDLNLKSYAWTVIFICVILPKKKSLYENCIMLTLRKVRIELSRKSESLINFVITVHVINIYLKLLCVYVKYETRSALRSVPLLWY